MKNKILISGHSEKGKRERNEDYFVTCSNESNQTLAVVCDGIGGDDDSQIASRLLASLFETTFMKKKFIKNFSSFYNKVLISATKQINKRSTFHRVMGTTVCVLLMSENSVEMANMGDSRIYFRKYGSSSWKLMSYDHNLYNYLRSKFQKQRENNPSIISIIDREEVKELTANKSKLFALTNCIETNSKPKVNDSYYKAVDMMEAGDVYHICSDGVYNWIKQQQIDEIIKETKDFNDLAANVIKAASANGSNDNLTSVFLKVQNGNK